MINLKKLLNFNYIRNKIIFVLFYYIIMSETTNINELPGNITMEKNEIITNTSPVYNAVIANENNSNQVNEQPVVPNSQAEMNKFISGLQQANVSGVTTIQQRDVPQNTTHITQDNTTVPNYIPENTSQPVEKADLNLINQQMDLQYNKTQNNDKLFDNLIEELQFPILIGLLFFAFQLPVVKVFLYNNFPSFYLNDGNYNLKGLLLISFIFSIMYYILNKIILSVS